MTGWTSPTHLVALLLIALLLFGAKRLPEIGRSLGSGMREFKDSVTRKVDEDAAEPRPLERSQAGETPVVDGEVVRERRS